MPKKVVRLFFSALVAMLLCLPSRGDAQCSVDYSTTNNFCDLSLLYLHAVPTSGTGPFTFIWETGETTETIVIPLAFGDYMLTMTDATGCTAIINCHIKPFPDVLFYPFAQDACEGDTVTLWLDWFRDSIPGATYLWSTGETTPTIELTDDLIWSVTVTDPATGCEFVIPPGLFDFHETPYPTLVGPSTICPGETVTLTVEGGPFGTIWWQNEDLYQATLDVTEPGTYIVWAGSPTAGWCWHQDTIVIGPGDLELPLLDGPPELCTGQNGVISVTNSNLFTSFIWNTGATSSSITVTNPGTYTVTVSNGGSCSADESITVGSGSGPQGAAIPQGTTCGLSNGSIDLSVTPASTYLYSWSNGMTTQDIANVPAGNYSVTITDLNGCSAVVAAVIPDQPLPININELITPNTSCNQFNGAIDLTISPGTNYTYQWSNGATTEDISSLGPGSYTITVTTAVNCIASETYTLTDNSNAVDITPNVIAESCGQGNGAISLQLIGGTAPFTFVWSNGSSAQDLSGLSSGNYSVTITGADGCMATTTAFVPDDIIPITLTAEIQSNTSCTADNGSIDLTVNPAGTYTISWSTGSNNEDLFNISPGNYSVTVTTGNTCVQSAAFIVTSENIPFTISGNAAPNTSCQLPNGYIDLSVDPVGAYSFTWSNGDINEDPINLIAGNYTVTVTNADGCSITSVFTIIDQTPTLLLSGVTASNSSCVTPNGSIDLTVQPVGNYQFQWSNGAITEDLANLSDTTYMVTVTDANQCSAIDTFIISNTTIPVNWTAIVQNETCLAGNGSISLDVSPAGNTFLWSNGQATEDLNSLTSGSYSITITNIGGCIFLDTFVVTNVNSNFSFNSILLDNTSCVASNGAIDLSVSPAGNYSYLWSNGASSEDINQLPGGIYSVTITDGSNCSSVGSFSLADAVLVPEITGTPTPSNCGSNNGSIDITVNAQGIITYMWSNGQTNEDIQDLSAGIYSVTVTNPDGCSATMDFIVTNLSSNFSVNGTTQDVTNCIVDNGAIDLQVSPSGNYIFAWSSGQDIEDLSALGAGNYFVTVTDGFGCIVVSNFNIAENFTLPSIEGIISPSACGQPNGSIDITVLPAGNYQYTWSNNAGSEDITSLLAGSYQVTVTSNDGCSTSGVFDVPNQNSNFSVTSTVTDDTSCYNSSGAIDLTVSPAGNYTFIWSNGATTEDLQNLTSGIYDVTVSDVSQCETHETFIIENLVSVPVIESRIQGTTCGEVNGSVDITVTPPALYTYNWSTGDSNEDLINLDPGTYAVTITDVNGCTATESFTIEGSSALKVNLNVELISQGAGQFICNLEINQPISAIKQIDWSPLDIMSCQDSLCTQQSFFITEETEISVMVIDTNGCLGSARLVLNVDKDYQIYIPNVFSPNGDGANDQFTIFTSEEVREIVLLEIFDRWGNNVFIKGNFPPNEPLLGWDGRFKEQDMNPAVFAYIATVRDSNDELHHYKGDVTLVR